MKLPMKDALILMFCGACLVLLALKLFVLIRPNTGQPRPSSGYLMAFGLMSVGVLFQVLYLVSQIVRGDNQKKEGDNV